MRFHGVISLGPRNALRRTAADMATHYGALQPPLYGLNGNHTVKSRREISLRRFHTAVRSHGVISLGPRNALQRVVASDSWSWATHVCDADDAAAL